MSSGIGLGCVGLFLFSGGSILLTGLYVRPGAEEAVKNKKELKQDRNAAIEAMGKMDIS